MNNKNANNYSYLDQVLQKNGAERLKTVFKDMAIRNKENSINMLNDKKLLFCTFFILMPIIEELNLYNGLIQRNIIAIKMCAKILKDDNLEHKITKSYNLDEKLIPAVLKWVIYTGSAFDGLCDDYDEVIDSSASLLINTYKDKAILPVIADLIFKRHNKGNYIHDLVWVFFRASDPDALKLIANYLRSSDPKIIELASKLLNFKPDNNNNAGFDKQFISYLNENSPYIHFTGESFLNKSSPTRYKVDLGAKYLCKNILPIDNEPASPYAENEQYCIELFNKLDYETQVFLADFSQKLNSKDYKYWKLWIQYPIEDEIRIAENGLGGRQ